MIADLIGKGGHIRTIPVPDWVKAGIDAWMAASGIANGILLRSNQQSWPSLGCRFQSQGDLGRGQGESKDMWDSASLTDISGLTPSLPLRVPVPVSSHASS